jgi:hypothetical protein
VAEIDVNATVKGGERGGATLPAWRPSGFSKSGHEVLCPRPYPTVRPRAEKKTVEMMGNFPNPAITTRQLGLGTHSSRNVSERSTTDSGWSSWSHEAQEACLGCGGTSETEGKRNQKFSIRGTTVHQGVSTRQWASTPRFRGRVPLSRRSAVSVAENDAYVLEIQASHEANLHWE